MVYNNPSFQNNYTSLCAKISDTLNRFDLDLAIPDFIAMATDRISRDMARIRHPYGLKRAASVFTDTYCTLPCDWIATEQLLFLQTNEPLLYLSPSQVKEVISEGWTHTGSRKSNHKHSYYTLIGDQIKCFPLTQPVDSVNHLDFDMWYWHRLPDLTNENPTNFILDRYRDLYLYASLMNAAVYLKADDRAQLFDGAYRQILADVEIEAERGTRSQTRLVANRRSF